jgi:hypothetical protein
MFKCSCVLCFHWTIWFFLRWRLDYPSFVNEINKKDFQSSAQLSLEPSTPIGSIQYVVSCFCAMMLPRNTSNKLQNSDYDKIPFLKIQFLLIVFDGDVLSELLPLFLNVHNPSQMAQGMDKRYDGHAYYKVIITNIKNSFRFSLRKVCCLGHYIVKTLCTLALAMKSFCVMSALIFHL